MFAALDNHMKKYKSQCAIAAENYSSLEIFLEETFPSRWIVRQQSNLTVLEELNNLTVLKSVFAVSH